jgi:hypothetical protein
MTALLSTWRAVFSNYCKTCFRSVTRRKQRGQTSGHNMSSSVGEAFQVLVMFPCWAAGLVSKLVHSSYAARYCRHFASMALSLNSNVHQISKLCLLS